jgi:transcriptional regulator with XRE-family HTH domain
MDKGRRTSRAFWLKRYERFRRALVAAREEAGLSQRQAADLIGRSQSFIAKCESGERRVDVVELAVLAATYGKPIAYFF